LRRDPALKRRATIGRRSAAVDWREHKQFSHRECDGFEIKMKLAQTNLSKLKACRKLARGKAGGRRPWSTPRFVTTLKGLRNFCSRICLAPFQGAEMILDFYPGYRFAQPRANFRQPFRLLQPALARN
jgi:hypothetical protein